jgi:serine phosphatase RsbU (regulator of sigma subunit)
VTGQVVRIDLDRQTATIVNAGHPSPLRLRARPGRSFQVQQLGLEPGDRIVFLTDGMLERNAAELDVYAALRDTAQLHPREVV